MRKLKYIFLFLVIAGCVDPYQFRIPDQSRGISVDAYLSDKSYNDSKLYPSDGRYFYVKLGRTSDVLNVRSEKIEGAVVELEISDGSKMVFDESGEPGTYLLLNDDFRAINGLQYRLNITTPEDDQIVSDWQSLPDSEAPAMGEINFKESTTPAVVLDQVVQKRGITPYISLPANTSGEPLYYRWTFVPTWIFVAPLVQQSDPYYRCWGSSIYYYQNFSVQKDEDGGYNKDFWFMLTDDNERILHEFSLLVEQQTLTPDFYNFWKEMQDLNQTDGIFSSPPYNLKTNYTSSGSSPVFGYFGVVHAQARRWYFSRSDLSYYIEDWWPAVCEMPCLGCPPPECLNCLQYELVTSITNQRPTWWGR